MVLTGVENNVLGANNGTEKKTNSVQRHLIREHEYETEKKYNRTVVQCYRM